MTHYDIHYSGSQSAMDRQALNDLVRWLGSAKYRQVLRAFRADPPKKHNSFALLFSLLGIGGRPVTAFERRYF